MCDEWDGQKMFNLLPCHCVLHSTLCFLTRNKFPHLMGQKGREGRVYISSDNGRREVEVFGEKEEIESNC